MFTNKSINSMFLTKETINNNRTLKSHIEDIKRVFPDVDLDGKSILFVDSAILNYGVMTQKCTITFYDENNEEIDIPINIRSRNNIPNKNYTHAVAANKQRLCNYGIPFVFQPEELAKVTHMILTWEATDNFPISITEFYTFYFENENKSPMFVSIRTHSFPVQFLDYIEGDPSLKKLIDCDDLLLRDWLDEFSVCVAYIPQYESITILIPTHKKEHAIDQQKAIERQMHECFIMMSQEEKIQMKVGFIFEKDVFLN